MSVETQAWIWEHSRAGGAEKLVQLALANGGAYGDDPTAVFLPASHWMIENLVSACAMHPDEVWDCMVALHDLGEIDMVYEVGRTVCVFTAMRSHRGQAVGL